MSKSRGAYPPEFRRQMVELVRAGRAPEELAGEFEPTAQSIRNWWHTGLATCRCVLGGRPRERALTRSLCDLTPVREMGQRRGGVSSGV